MCCSNPAKIPYIYFQALVNLRMIVGFICKLLIIVTLFSIYDLKVVSDSYIQ